MFSYSQISSLLEWLLIIVLLFNSMYFIRKLQERPVEKNEPQSVNEQNNSLVVGNIFPVTHMIDVKNTPVNFDNQNYLGTILLLSVYGCSSCAQLYPNMNSISDHFKDYQVAAIMIGTSEEISRIINEHGISVPVHQIEMHQMGNYGTFTFPFCYILSNNGVIIQKGHVQTVNEVAELLPSQNQVTNRNLISVSV